MIHIKNYLILFVVLFSLCYSVISCGEEVKETTLTATPINLQFEEKGGTQEITIETNRSEWFLAGMPSWIVAEKLNEKKINVTAKPNEEKTARTGSFKITANDKSIEISVKQAPQTFLTVKSPKVEFGSSGGSAEITIETNAEEWNLKQAPDWIEAKKETDKIIIQAAKNTRTESREGLIEVEANKRITTIAVWQAPISVLEISPSVLEFSYKGGVQEVTLKINKKILREFHLGTGVNFELLDNGSIKVTAQYNSEEKENTAKLVLEVEDARATLLVKQAANTIEKEQREILIAFYRATNGDQWKDRSNWLSEKSIYEWKGVLGEKGYGVSTLTLSDNELSGSIPKEIGMLETLSFINLSKNNLNGQIPSEIAKLTELRHLSLHSNNLSGNIPPEMGEMPKLGYLYLHDNNLSGKIPEALFKLASKRFCPQKNNGTFDNYDCNSVTP